MKKITKRDRQSLSALLLYSFILDYAHLVLDVSGGRYEVAPARRLFDRLGSFVSRFYEDTFVLSDFYDLLAAQLAVRRLGSIWVGRYTLYKKAIFLKEWRGKKDENIVSVDSSRVVRTVREYLFQAGSEKASRFLRVAPVRLTKERFFDFVREDFFGDFDRTQEELERELSFVGQMGGLDAPEDDLEGTSLYRCIAALSALDYRAPWDEETFRYANGLLENAEITVFDLITGIERLYADLYRLLCVGRQVPETPEGWDWAKETLYKLITRTEKGDFSAFDEELEGELTDIEKAHTVLMGHLDAFLNEKEPGRAETVISGLLQEGFYLYAEAWQEVKESRPPAPPEADAEFFYSKFSLLREKLLKGWEGKPKLLVRFAMANVLSALANPFGSVDNVCDYLKTSLDICEEPLERRLAMQEMLRAAGGGER